MAKFGEFNSARLKPTWEDTSKPGNDKTGWKRGGRSWEDGESKFMRSADPAFDKIAYGSGTEKRRADAIFDLTDRFKGAKGVDADDNSDGTR